ncbi:S8 family serine peptidase [Bacillus aerolatus]|uniref:S8 family serine peptidase n=1 Tax=Bacillus aerolatus TaxID=2653354 RepID=A0A6I1FIJ3_9BACI|nr:S8 family serine peptidase [Bacillus aerolatus]KAB7708247.1 S8 family serine peptidase [Bacillus aerolatus]
MTTYQYYMAEGEWGKGKRIKIAHIDSGLNEWHPHVGKAAGGIAFQVSKEGKITIEENYHDDLGHGTAVAGVIKEQVPEAEMFAVKIFHDKLFAYIEVLCAAIEWCIEKEMDLINLSLGVNKDVDAFRFICDKANEAGAIIISACDETNGLFWPGYYNSAYAVQSLENGNSQHFQFCPGDPIQFKTLGFPRSLEGPMQKFNFQGHSFAAAHMTGFIAKIKEKYPEVRTKQEMNQLLKEIGEHQFS